MASSSNPHPPQGAGLTMDSQRLDQVGDMTLLLNIPEATLSRVFTREEMLEEIAQGQLDLTAVTLANGQIALMARVGDADFAIGPDTCCLRCGPSQYVFNMGGGVVYGVTFPEGVDPEVTQLLEAILHKCCQFAVQEGSGPAVTSPALPKPLVVRAELGKESGAIPTVQVVEGAAEPVTTTDGRKKLPGEQVAEYVRQTGLWGEAALSKGGEILVQRIKDSEEYWKQRTQKYQKPVRVHRTILGAAKVAGSAAGGVYTASSKLMGAVGKAIDVVAGGVISTASGLGIKGSKESKYGIRLVAFASVEAVSRILDAVEVSGKKILVTSKTTTAEYMDHRYGPEVAQLTEDSMGGTGSLIAAGWTLRKVTQLGPLRVTRKVMGKAAAGIIITTDSSGPQGAGVPAVEGPGAALQPPSQGAGVPAVEGPEPALQPPSRGAGVPAVEGPEPALQPPSQSDGNVYGGTRMTM